MTIEKRRSLEAAKRQRAETSGALPEAVMTIRKAPTDQTLIKTCLGCGGNFHQGGQRQCPVYNLTCDLCQQTGHLVKVCRSRQPQPPTPHTLAHPATKAMFAAAPTEGHTPQISTTKVGNPEAIQSAPTIRVHISSLNGKTEIEVLPDSGANLSLAGEATLTRLGEHKDNLLTNTITPCAVNQTEMQPLGKLPVTIMLGSTTYTDNLHIYLNETGMLLSWKAAKGLHILPECYPNPTLVQALLLPPFVNHTPTSEEIMHEFPTVFDGQIKTMEGEDNAQPFCVNTPRAVPFAY